MRIGRSKPATSKTRVMVLTADGAFAQAAQDTFATTPQIELTVVPGTLGAVDKFDIANATVAVVDIDASSDSEMQALQTLVAKANGWPPVIAVTQVFDEAVARRLLQMRVADFLAKPVVPAELVRACAHVANGPSIGENTDAQVYSFLPAVGGAGVTTLAIQTAMLLLQAGPRGQSTTCLVDLDFQNGACADYLDLEPRLNLREIEPRPERLDRQLLEVMLSYHPSGLAVIAAPNRPAEMRSFNPEVVMRLLDLVSTNFNNVVFDLPRTWFSWTDSVLLGSNRLYIVSEMTVPGLRHAKHLVDAIGERLKEGPPPKVIVNRFEQRLFAPGLRRSDVEQTLGASFETAIPNHYRLVREAIDRGVPLDEVKPGNKISQQLKKLVEPRNDAKGNDARAGAAVNKLKLAAAR
jgi:pilus assembly protein CpaE